MMRTRLLLFSFALSAAIASGCDSDGGAADQGPGPADDQGAAEPTVQLRDVDGTPILVDGEGRTLYLFSNDVPGPDAVSNCAGDCLTAWPAFSPDAIRPGAGLDVADFGALTRSDGSSQATYRGWPLYYFASDTAPGETNGEAVGNVWFVIPDPFYTVLIRANADLGRFLTDAAGNTLYYFARDTPAAEAVDAVSNCAGDCLAAWPALDLDEVIAPSTLNLAAFDSISRDDGGAQTTYRGWPMYTFQNDAAVGDTNGEGVGGVWFVFANPFYSALIMGNDEVPLYLADDRGFSLYLFRNDTKGEGDEPPVSACEGDCLTAWPPFALEAGGAPSVLNDEDFTVLSRDGVEQVVYRGWPLYFFANDEVPGDVNGDGVGEVWELFDPSTLGVE